MGTTRPVIGITRCRKMDDYVASVEQAGGRPRILDVSESPRKLLGELDGLVLTGGGDVDPALYGEERHPLTEDAEPGRDEFEVDLARRAMDADLPVLGICRGAQVLNVAAGGTLIQDVPSAIETDLSHSLDEPKHEIAHDVAVAAGSRLERALGPAVSAEKMCRVNSRHHQSVGRLGRSLRPSATAADGVIEAIESSDASFCIGVQWHPENFWKTGEFNGLFDNFIAQARLRQDRRTHGPKDPRTHGPRDPGT